MGQRSDTNEEQPAPRCREENKTGQRNEFSGKMIIKIVKNSEASCKALDFYIQWEEVRIKPIDPETVVDIWVILHKLKSFPGGAVVKNLPANAEDAREVSLIHGSGRSLGGGNSNPLQYSCLENSMDRGAWWATIHGVGNSWT